MAIGVVSDEDFLAELGNLTQENNKPSTAQVVNIERGRGEGNKGVPESLQKIIGETAIENGRQEARQLTQALGVSDSSLSAYSNGATSTASYHKPSPTLKPFLEKTKRRIARKAAGRLNTALKSITDEKLAAEDARDLAAIAKDMSAIIRNMEPEKENNGAGPTQNNQFILMSPPPMTEDKFDVVIVNE